MSNYVIVPLDGSKLAEEALPMGIALAQEAVSDGVVQVVQVIPKLSQTFVYLPDNGMNSLELHEAFRASAENYLGKIKTQLAEAGGAVETLVVDGKAGPALAKLANREEVSYVVMSTHGRGGVSRWTLGSVADQVLQLIERPLIIMRSETVSDAPLAELSGGMPKIGDLPQLKRIVVPLDGSPFAEQVLPHAKKLARAYDAELLLLRSVSATPPGMIGSDVALLETRLYEINRNQARDYLKRIKLDLQVEGFKVGFEISGGQAADAILSYADNIDADLIAMCTHARGAISRMVMGSVADGIIRAGQVPVLAIKAETKE
ncbi:MAG: universal stress protein [Ardenticatenaceae bacterium]